MTIGRRSASTHGSVPVVDGFQVVERTYGPDDSLPSVGLANIHAVVPGIEQNKDKILRATHLFRDLGVNVVVFPEFALSGYFWDDEVACRSYMDQALTEHHRGFIDELRALCDDQLRVIVLNNLTGADDGTYRNRTMLVSSDVTDPLDEDASYDKVFLPGIEKRFTSSGLDDRLVVRSADLSASFGFTTCYDYLFTELLRRYSFEDGVDGIVQLASWRGASSREYPYMNVRTDVYYGQLWDTVLAASSAQNQVWTIACNAVGTHEISDAEFWGGSGVWAPSGIPLVQGSHFHDELVVVHNLDIAGARRYEIDDFDYEFDFREVHRAITGGLDVERLD